MKAKLRLGIVTVSIFIALVILYNFGWQPGGNLFREDTEEYHYKGNIRRPSQHFAWNTHENDSTDSSIDRGKGNDTTVAPRTCRNSVQGRTYIVDDKGYVCLRVNVEGDGCCDKAKASTKRYFCEQCDDSSGCCRFYEDCASCCMDPKHQPALAEILKEAHEKNNILLQSASDQFELCLAKCRTNSGSVQHENLYVNPKRKFCFMNRPAKAAEAEKSQPKDGVP